METFVILRLLVLSIVVFTFISDGHSLKDVTLVITPPVVQRGRNVTLLCHYDLEGQQLYAVKWYRGQFEFYRYNPSETPNKKVFLYNKIRVDLSQSNGSQVVLCDLGFNLSGNFSCEVTTEGPGFVTAVAVKHMMVVDFPKKGPVIMTNKTRYDPGDQLVGNCSSSPSKPPANLSFYINNHPVSENQTRFNPGPDSLTWSFLAINITLLSSHFDYHQEVLPLRCTATIGRLYSNTTELRISNRKEPIPERGKLLTSRVASSFRLHSATLPITWILLIHARQLMAVVPEV